MNAVLSKYDCALKKSLVVVCSIKSSYFQVYLCMFYSDYTLCSKQLQSWSASPVHTKPFTIPVCIPWGKGLWVQGRNAPGPGYHPWWPDHTRRCLAAPAGDNPHWQEENRNRWVRSGKKKRFTDLDQIFNIINQWGLTDGIWRCWIRILNMF